MRTDRNEGSQVQEEINGGLKLAQETRDKCHRHNESLDVSSKANCFFFQENSVPNWSVKGKSTKRQKSEITTVIMKQQIRKSVCSRGK